MASIPPLVPNKPERCFLPNTRHRRSQGRKFLHRRPHRRRIIILLLKSVSDPRSADLERVCVCALVAFRLDRLLVLPPSSPLIIANLPQACRYWFPYYKASASFPKSLLRAHLALHSRGNHDWAVLAFSFISFHIHSNGKNQCFSLPPCIILILQRNPRRKSRELLIIC